MVCFPKVFGKQISKGCYKWSNILMGTSEIYASFDCNPPLDVRGVSLDTSKAFDRVWHNGIIYKIKCIGINGMFPKSFWKTDFKGLL